MIDTSVMVATAGKYNIPPPILFGLVTMGVGADQKIETPLDLERYALALSTIFQRTGDWQSALGQLIGGTPDSASSPTSTVGAQVNAILGVAGARPTWGMDAFIPADIASFTAMSRAFGTSMTGLSQLGGVVTPANVQAWYRSASDARGRSDGSFMTATGRSMGPAPFGFDKAPFDPKYLDAETESFGDTSGPGGYAEQGNDYGLPHGTALSAPISGKVKVVRPSDPYSGTGLTVYIVRPDGSRVYIGHMGTTTLQDGQMVGAGDPIGTSGGVPGVDEYPGNSTGAHVEIGMYDSRGNLYDPRQVLLAVTQNPAKGRVGGGGTPPPQLVAALKKAGFTGQGLQTMLAIAGAESSYNPHALGHNDDGSVDRGVFQINNRWHSEVSDADAFDIEKSAAAAFKISNGGRDFSPWSTYTGGQYQGYLVQQKPEDTINPAAVDGFAQQLKGAGATPEHFRQIYPVLSQVRQRLLGVSTSLEDFFPHVGQTPDQVLASVRATPHPIYPEHTVGAFHDTNQIASLYSFFHIGKEPLGSEVARFLSGGLSHQHISDYYASQAKQTPVSPPQDKEIDRSGGGVRSF